ncbi:MAG: ADP-ribosylglycohydrolase family protein [Acidiferrobacter sp.]
MRDRFVGCLLGGAVGDALGAPVEFLDYAEILERFGPAGITSYAPAYGRLGAITDDTQMTLFTAEGLIRRHVRLLTRGIASTEGMVAAAYARWLRTQSKPRPGFEEDEEGLGWLYSHADLHHRRGPGNTCLGALRAMTVRGDPARNNSKGCGGVMRMAPVGLVFGRGRGAPHETMTLGKSLAALTHGHPTGSIAAGAFAVLIAEIVQGRGLVDALPVVHACLADEVDGRETEEALAQAESMAAKLPQDPATAIAHIGGGWIAEEALAIAVYCALTARDFADGVIRAVNHGGDSDSTGSITGNILGALWGVDAIPTSFLEPLELREVITELAVDLATFLDWDIAETDDGGARPNRALQKRVWEKYPGY